MSYLWKEKSDLEDEFDEHGLHKNTDKNIYTLGIQADKLVLAGRSHLYAKRFEDAIHEFSCALNVHNEVGAVHSVHNT